MEIRVTIEALNPNGDIVANRVVLGEHDEEGLPGDIEAALDDVVAEYAENAMSELAEWLDRRGV